MPHRTGCPTGCTHEIINIGGGYTPANPGCKVASQGLITRFRNQITKEKTALVILGILFGGGALACHFVGVNAIAVYTLGGVGGAFVVGPLALAAWQTPRLKARLLNAADFPSS